MTRMIDRVRHWLDNTPESLTAQDELWLLPQSMDGWLPEHCNLDGLIEDERDLCEVRTALVEIAVERATSLGVLADILNTWGEGLPAESLCELPTFGGLAPDALHGLYSWDAHRVLRHCSGVQNPWTVDDEPVDRLEVTA